MRLPSPLAVLGFAILKFVNMEAKFKRKLQTAAEAVRARCHCMHGEDTLGYGSCSFVLPQPRLTRHPHGRGRAGIMPAARFHVQPFQL